MKRALSAALITSALVTSPALGCGFHDEVSLQRGVMNWAYPDSLHVRSAVWRAQSDGVLARDQLAEGEMTPEARATFGLLRAQRLMNQLGAALQHAPSNNARAPISVVLLGPLLWSRFEPSTAGVQTRFHVDGPQTGDAVIVTELPTLEALVSGRLTFSEALTLGVLKIYAPTNAAANAQRWLAAMKTTR